jgi:hypothetical protein
MVKYAVNTMTTTTAAYTGYGYCAYLHMKS